MKSQTGKLNTGNVFKSRKHFRNFTELIKEVVVKEQLICQRTPCIRNRSLKMEVPSDQHKKTFQNLNLLKV